MNGCRKYTRFLETLQKLTQNECCLIPTLIFILKSLKSNHLCSSVFIFVHLYSSSTILVHLHVSSLIFALLWFPIFDHCATSAHLHLDLFEFGWPNVFFIKKESPRVAWDVWVLSRQTFLTDTTCAHYYSLRSKTQSSFVTKRSTFGNAKDQIKCEINSQKMNCKRCHDVATYL